MKKIVKAVAVISMIIFSCNSNAASISEAVCKQHELVMRQVVFGYRQNGVPINSVRNVFNHERDGNVQLFLVRVVEEIYANPESGKNYLDSGSFLENCVKIHRGY